MAKTIMECWDMITSPEEHAKAVLAGAPMGFRMYEYMTGTQWNSGSGRGQTGHYFGQANIDEWTAKNNKIRNDSTVETTTVKDLLGL